jgi:hypothetical protein
MAHSLGETRGVERTGGLTHDVHGVLHLEIADVGVLGAGAAGARAVRAHAHAFSVPTQGIAGHEPVAVALLGDGENFDASHTSREGDLELRRGDPRLEAELEEQSVLGRRRQRHRLEPEKIAGRRNLEPFVCHMLMASCDDGLFFHTQQIHRNSRSA